MLVTIVKPRTNPLSFPYYINPSNLPPLPVHLSIRSAAKHARDNRQITNQPPLRKERAELEALQATLEKMKIDHEAALRKARMAEKRLLQLTKDQSMRCEELEAQVSRD